ncbi:hypothetical protein PENSPDRAFT_672615, partial [Peniophora sp. CONT]
TRARSVSTEAANSVHLATVDVKGKSVAHRLAVTNDTLAVTNDTDAHMIESDEGTQGFLHGAQDVDVDEGAQNDDGEDTGVGMMDEDTEHNAEGMPEIISRAGSLALDVADEESGRKDKGDGKKDKGRAADIFAAVKDGRPVQANKPVVKKKAESTEKKKKTESKQVQLEVESTNTSQSALEEPFLREDGVPIKGKFLRRLVIMSAFANDDECMYYIRCQPDGIVWSAGKPNVSSLVIKGQCTRVRWIIAGQLTWNGLIQQRNDKGDLVWPTRAKVSIKCLRDGDFLAMRNILKDYSESSMHAPMSLLLDAYATYTGNNTDVQNMTSISAYIDTGVRQRGSDVVAGQKFTKVYNGEKKAPANKVGMEKMEPNQLIRGDIVLVEMSVGRYYDQVREANWKSTRAYCRLEAVTLLLPGDAQDAPKKSSSSKRRVNVPMDMAI